MIFFHQITLSLFDHLHIPPLPVSASQHADKLTVSLLRKHFGQALIVSTVFHKHLTAAFEHAFAHC